MSHLQLPPVLERHKYDTMNASATSLTQVSTVAWELPSYHSLIPKVKQDNEDEKDIKVVADSFPQCAHHMKQRVQCERAHRNQAEICDQLYGKYFCRKADAFAVLLFISTRSEI